MNKEQYDKLIDLIAKWIFIADQRWEIEDHLDQTGQDYDTDDANDMIVDLWIRHLQALDEDPWKNGKHYGDCTQIPMSCFRCIVDEYYSKAEEELKMHLGDIRRMT